MTTLRKTCLALHEIVSTLEADLDWLTPEARVAFVEKLKRERDEAVVILIAQATGEGGGPASGQEGAQAIDRDILCRVVASLRADGGAERLALADALEDRSARTR